MTLGIGIDDAILSQTLNLLEFATRLVLALENYGLLT